MNSDEIRLRLQAAISAGRHFRVGATIARAIPLRAPVEDGLLGASLLLVDAARRHNGDKEAFLDALTAAVRDTAGEFLRRIEEVAA